MTKKNYILDTSVYLTDADALYNFRNNDIFVPLKVLEEIDKHKKRQDSVGVNARKIIRHFDELRGKGSLTDGVRIGKGLGLLRAVPFTGVPDNFPTELDIEVPDHVIIATAWGIKQNLISTQENRKTILVSRDINMRVICDSIGLPSEDYISEEIITSSEELYQGFTTHVVDDEIIDRMYAGDEIYIPKEEAKTAWHPNEFVMLVSNANQKKSALARFEDHNKPLRRLIHTEIPDWRIKSRNKEQSFAIDLLLDPRVKVVSLVGRAGSGKTLCAIAAGLDQTIGMRGTNKYDRLIVSRPVQPLGKDIGFLPGTMEEKMLPWLMPIQDNLQFLLGGTKEALQMYMSKGKIEVEAITFIRGRSISNSFIIIDEAQNLTAHEIKTILTRVGEGTKIVLTGDIEQIDNAYVDEFSNGLTYAVEKFKEYDLSGHVTLLKGERSKVATLAAKIL